MKQTFSRVVVQVAAMVALVTAAGVSLAAHDMWIEPTSFSPESGKIIGLRLQVGQDFLGDPLPRDPALFEQFVSIDASGRKPIVGQDGADPAGLLRISQPGLTIVGYRSHPSPIVLASEKFNQYLRDEGLDRVAAERARRHETSKEAREIFARCAKSLVLAGPPTAGDGDRAIGFTLELIAERNPYTMRAGDELPVRLVYEGRPLAGALVVAMNRRNPSAKRTARTDAAGRVRLPLGHDGVWLVKAVHMIPAPAGSGADWASFWASLTFELNPAASNRSTR